MRIVTHTCSNTEIVAALGLGDQIVGVDDHSDHPPEVVARAARVGPDQDIDVERVLALAPDLVITSLTIPGHERCVERLEAAGLELLVLEPTALAHVPRDMRAIGAALGVAARAERLAKDFETAVHRVASRDGTRGADGARPRVLVEWWPKPVIAPAAGSWVSQMLDLAGGINPWASEPGKSIPLSDEAVLDARPDAVVIAWCGVPFDKYRPEVVRRRAGWSELPAVAGDRIFCVSEAWLGRPGPRLVEGLGALAAIVAACGDPAAVIPTRFGEAS